MGVALNSFRSNHIIATPPVLQETIALARGAQIAEFIEDRESLIVFLSLAQ